jgi:UDP-N-acetylmuramoylalanine--D-glutamate ligase
VIKAYLIGEAALEFAGTLDGKAPYVLSRTIQAATRAAFEDARESGEEAIVLLSPACASFDQFADFEDRGEAFRTAVHALTGAPAAARSGRSTVTAGDAPAPRRGGRA